MEVSRVLLNKAVVREFGISAAHLLEQRLLQEIKMICCLRLFLSRE